MLRRSLAYWVSMADIETRIKSAAVLAPVKDIQVSDLSAGCGSFFKVEVTSEVFRDKTLLQQHRLVQDVLKKEISELHGITIVSKVPPA